jgi:transcription initiation factor TFIIIB Brf1 subunit/transcription initiation factor TFIIB
MVCPNCGIVGEKQVVMAEVRDALRSPLSVRQTLGSYMGPKVEASEEKYARSIAGSNSRYAYLKVVSDFAGRDEGSAARCVRMLERVAEKLTLPWVVVLQAASIARKVLLGTHSHHRVTVASVSAYSLIAACKIEGITSVNVREVIEAHAVLGKRVSASSIIQLTLESPIRTYARRPEEYLSRVLAHLSSNMRLMETLSSEGVPKAVYFNSLREIAIEILSTVDEGKAAGRRPCALAASAVYSAEMVKSVVESRRKRFSQREIAECGDTAEYTIREQCAEVFTPAAKVMVSQRMPMLLPVDAS